MVSSITGLFVYPVKSCRGIATDAAALAERGLLHDREWMIVESRRPGDSAAQFVTQREYPRLALVATALSASSLTLSSPGFDDLVIGLERDGERTDVVVWRDTVAAIDQGPEAAAWLSAFAGTELRLVRFDSRHQRLCNTAFAGDSGAHTAFADGYPVLVISAASLDDLNGKLAARGKPALPMDRFRPNIVVDGIDAYDEDHLSLIRIGDVELRMVKPCMRCRITTIDQQTAEVGEEPLSILAGYRNNARLGGVAFGMNAIVVAGAGATIRRGAPISVEWNF